MDTFLLNITKLNILFFEKAKRVNTTGMDVLMEELDAYDPAHREWQLAYSFRSQYGVENFSPETFAKLIDRMRDDDELLGRFYRFAHSPSANAFL